MEIQNDTKPRYIIFEYILVNHDPIASGTPRIPPAI
jgi:hypothetical protein